MQKHKNTHQDTNKEEERRTTPGKRTKKINANKDNIDFFLGGGGDNIQRDQNLQQRQTNRATPAKRTNGGSRVKTQYRKEKHNILRT
jgi:hypothetical protein